MKKLLLLLFISGCAPKEVYVTRVITYDDGFEIRTDTVIYGNVVRAGGAEYKVSEYQKVK